MNTQVLQVPDLSYKVVGVRLRFQPVALMADVEPKYHQLKVHPGDVDMERQNCLMVVVSVILGGYVIIFSSYVIIFGD